MKLPKQSSPIIRHLSQSQAKGNNSGVSAAGIDDCYKLRGAARDICLAGYSS
jgi:hypothetical protein